jgi:hypothetical protein
MFVIARIRGKVTRVKKGHSRPMGAHIPGGLKLWLTNIQAAVSAVRFAVKWWGHPCNSLSVIAPIANANPAARLA